MKKIIAISVLAAMLLSGVSCGNTAEKAPEVTTAETDSAPVAKPVPVTLDEVYGYIDQIKAEYDSASEVTLSDGTVITIVAKPAGITAQSVASGEATVEDMTAYATYMANVRRLVCDRLPSYFPENNRIDFGDVVEEDVEIMFLDPAADGYETVGVVFSEMFSEDNEDEVLSDYVTTQNGMVLFLEADTNESTVICPDDDENQILAAISARMSAK